MSRFMRLKHVLKEMMEDDFALPEEQQQIVRLAACRGNNLHEVESANSEEKNFLVTMPTKFRNNVFVKRGDFLVVEPIEEGAKVKAEILKILTTEHVKEYTKAGIWPKRFTKEPEVESTDEEDEGDDDGDKFMVRNKNRPAEPLPLHTEETDSDEESDDDDEDEEDELQSSSSAEEEGQEVKPK